MAAYGALVSLWNDLELIPNHPTHSFSFETKQISSLSQIVDSLIHFMDTNAPHGEVARVLESRIASAAHAAHDVIESQVVDQIHAGTTLDGRSRSFFLLDLQKATDDLEFVNRKAIRFQQNSGSKVEQLTYSARASCSSEPPTSEKNVMVGFDDVAVRLMDRLTGEPSSQRIFLPIVGMGGIGKTTLAKYAFENLYCKHHFDVRRWATLSHEYNLETILSELFSGNQTPNSIGNVNELGEQLHKMLWNRRYLIVLDDMWSAEAWDEIQRFLPDNENGSCVIVTTRISNLAAYFSSSPFQMDFLDDSQSWKLFCGSAFGEEDCPTELEGFGKKIVGRCNGLPLSIVVTGGHLKRSSRAIEYWEMVANLMNPILGLGEDEQCLNIIHLSYEHLPPCLKPCFLYLGIFGEDQRIAASQLLSFWVAEGFVRSCTSLSMEEVADDYLKDLIDRNLILVERKRWDGKVEFCVIHDIVRELCLKVGKQEKFIGVLDTTKAIGECRIVVPRELTSSSSLQIQKDDVGGLQLPSKFRSLICQGVGFLDELSADLRLLRLSTYNVFSYNSSKKNDIYSVPAMFWKVNLRFVTFYVPPAGAAASPYWIPWSISLLWNVQTLVIDNRDNFVVLPYEIWEMMQLRHLEITSVVGRCHLPDPNLPYGVICDRPRQQECIVLENLHTLLGVMDLRLTKEVCQRMPNIKKLRLSYYGFPNDDDNSKESSYYYCLHNLGRLNKLESLTCCFSRDESNSKWSGVVRSIILPTSLEELTLWRCHLEDLTKILKSLPRLGYLSLSDVRGPKWDLAEDEEEEFQLPRLKTLRIYGCRDLVFWNASSSHFPILEKLHIWKAPELREIPFDIGEIPTLGLINLTKCSVSAAASAMRIVSEQESQGNEDIILKVNFEEMEEVERFQSMVEEECLTTNNLRLFCAFKKIIISRLPSNAS